jgi:hypothetical protein
VKGFVSELSKVEHKFSMPETKLKSLYKGKSVSDLEKYYDIGELTKGKKAKM